MRSFFDVRNLYLLNVSGERGLSLPKTVGFDRLNQLCPRLLRRYRNFYCSLAVNSILTINSFSTVSVLAKLGGSKPKSVIFSWVVAVPVTVSP